MYQPLADQLRPKSLDEVAGQRHILGEGGVLRRIIQGGTIPNLIFYGPSGTGKTTVAEIAAARIHRPFYRLNATTASLADIKAITADVGTLLAPGRGWCCIWMRFSTSTRNSSNPCWSLWRMGN